MSTTIDNLLEYASTATTRMPHILSSVGKISFSWYDYTLFVGMLGLSTMIGIYFGCFGSKQSTTHEYLLGGKKMKVIPIAVSLVASHISGITLLAVPADIYRYGSSYWIGSICMVLLHFITVYIYLPVFYKLEITSTYEYLSKRFDDKNRMLASFLYALSLLLYLPIVIYLPALALSAATGINVHLITPIVCGVCIFYTTIGGLKAVVWTDTLQFTVTMGALTAVFFMGLKAAGGISNVWNTSLEGHRLDIFDFDPDPTKRDTFWIVFIGLTVGYTSLTSINQGCVQKFLAVPTLEEAKTAVFLYCMGTALIKTVCVVLGLIMYTNYVGCDPFTTKVVSRNDQLLPYFVMDVAGKIPGLPGLFIAGVFSAALSTLSANLNCISGTIYTDFISRFIKSNIPQKTASNILKLIVVITGIICTTLVYVVEHLGGILRLSITLKGICDGPLLGLFTLGMIFRRANSKGAFIGSIVGLIFMSFVLIMVKYYESQGLMKYDTKPLSVEECELPLNVTIPLTLNETFIKMETQKFKPFVLFRISYYYYTLMGASITVIVGLIVSYLTNHNDPPAGKEVLSPIVYFMLSKEDDKLQENLQYYNIKKALHIVTMNDLEKEDQSRVDI